MLKRLADHIRIKLNPDKLFPSSVFRSGERFSGHHINCSANPYDLRPAADIIIGAASQMIKNIPEDQPLVILVGEYHTMPAHKELQHIVTSHLRDMNEHFTFNFEMQHNKWATIASRTHSLAPVSKDLLYNCSSYDSDGKAALSAFMAGANPEYAPIAVHNMMASCYHNGIASSFSDVAAFEDEKGFFLDMKDPFTAAVASEYARSNNKKSLNDMAVSGQNGMAIRNLVMARRGLEHAKENKARLIVQGAGLLHVFGSYRHGLSYEDSLCAAYRRAGAAVLPVFLAARSQRFGLNNLPEAAYKELDNSVVIEGLSEKKFCYGDKGEKEFITEKLHKNSGGELEFYDVRGERKKYTELALGHATELMGRAAANDNHNKNSQAPSYRGANSKRSPSL